MHGQLKPKLAQNLPNLTSNPASASKISQFAKINF